MKDYQELIKELIADSNKQLLVKHQDFSDFHQAWLRSPNRDEIVGKALKGGDIIYRYVSKN